MYRSYDSGASPCQIAEPEKKIEALEGELEEPSSARRIIGYPDHAGDGVSEYLERNTSFMYTLYLYEKH